MNCSGRLLHREKNCNKDDRLHHNRQRGNTDNDELDGLIVDIRHSVDLTQGMHIPMQVPFWARIPVDKNMRSGAWFERCFARCQLRWQKVEDQIRPD
jgi:hypothetical protein